ncbi:MAG: ATP-binding protein [Leptolyngbyaceae bacterium]|nr:ATP-binding protein [Leptolyngbyaceae bacterium]
MSSMSASPEFVQICQAQLEILSSGLGASLCIVYLTDAMPGKGDGKLVPVVVYPEHLMPWAETELLSWLQHDQPQDDDPFLPDVFSGFEGEESRKSTLSSRRSPPPESPESSTSRSPRSHPLPDERNPSFIQANGADRPSSAPLGRGAYSSSEFTDVSASEFITPSAIAPLTSELAFPQQHQIALPLVYEGMMVGLLVTGRPDRFWTDHEHHQIEQIAKTIGISCVVDRRERWLEERMKAQRQLPSPQHDVFDDLIHQFRNPLTALRTFGKLLMRRLPSSDRNFSVAESIVRESDRLQELLQYFKVALDEQTPQLPQFSGGSAQKRPQALPPHSGHQPPEASHQSEHESGDVEDMTRSPALTPDAPVIDVSSSATYLTGHDITPMPCPLPNVLAPLIDVAWAIAEDQEVSLTVEIAPDVSSVQADPKGLQEVLSNLIDNAIKYTPSGGQVLIRVPAPHPDKQAVIVADTGMGIPEADQVHLFERHFRGVQEAGDIPGTGLGLAIALDLIEKMDGTIRVFSPAASAPLLSDWRVDQSENPGTAFVVWLNRAA